jgi:hypothetical protein
MRKLITWVLFCSVLFGWAQAPEEINFQTVLHETEGSILANQSVKLIVNIISESSDGDIVYREEHSVTSNQFGLINLKIGSGAVLYGSWQDIMWSEQEQYMLIELDSSGSGNSYMDMGIAQMLSVPYALFANQSETQIIWEQNDNGISYSGKVSIGKDVAEEDLDLADDLKVELSTDQPDLTSNDLVKVMMDADTAEPTINWRNENEVYTAGMSVVDFNTSPLTSSKRFLLATASGDFARRYRMEIRYDQNISDLFLANSNLIVENQFSSYLLQNIFWSHHWVNNGYLFGIGDKNWETAGVYGNAAAEMYSSGSDNFMVLNAAEELDRVQMILRRGESEWVCGHDDVFYFKRNDSKKIKFMPNGNIKLGSNDPEYKLDVYGNINIPDGSSYLIGGGKSGDGKYAEYFQAEEAVELGSLVGMNIETGLVRNYQQGDVFVGIACQATGFIANAQFAKSNQYILVGLEGLLEFNSQKSQIANHQVFTNDGIKIGSLIGNKVFLQ